MKILNKPVIGIVPSFDEGNNIPAGTNVKRVYIRHEYMDRVAKSGAIPIILHPEMSIDVITEMCDGIVISGGEDIEPEYYGQQPVASPRFNEPNARYDWEDVLIQACDANDIPILGICYGLQRLNVHYGGTLLQDIETAMPENIGHDKTEHDVTFSSDFLGINGTRTIASRHHQAIDVLADGFEVKAKAADGIIEAIEGHGHYGIQWHPESDDTGLIAYNEFVKRCAAVKQPATAIG